MYAAYASLHPEQERRHLKFENEQNERRATSRIKANKPTYK